MASLQLNGLHICSSGMFQNGFLLTTNICAWYIGEGIEEDLQRGTAVLGNSDLKIGQKINIFKIAYVTEFYTSSRRPRNDHDVGLIMVGKI